MTVTPAILADPVALRDLVHAVVEGIADYGRLEATMAAETVRIAGITPNMATDLPAEDYPKNGALLLWQWLLGGFLDLVETQFWAAINTWLGVAQARLDDYPA